MKTIFKILFVCVAAWAFLGSCQRPAPPRIMTGENEVVEFRVLPFELKDVRLLEGRFLEAVKLNETILLNYEPDRFLAWFRREAGLELGAENYGGWENTTLAGHSLGHYLSAISMIYQFTNNEEFLNRAKYIVDELEKIQNAHGNGYIGAMENGRRILEEEVAKGNIRASGFDLNGLWAPFYTHHKILAGLRDAYELLGIEKARVIGLRFADWIYGIVGHLTYEQRQSMLRCEYGGINEVFADFYGITGNEKYLNLARLFHDNFVLDSLALGYDILPGKHANTNIPKVTGLARRFELTGNLEEKTTSLFFWNRVVNYHSYVTGGNGLREYFGPPGQLRNRLESNTAESCNVYNMLKLTNHLFTWSADAQFADFYERALFNHTLSAQHPVDGRVIYHLSVDMGGRKVYQNPFGFTCCVGSGMETWAKRNGSIYFHNNEELFVSQFIASELNWREKNLIVRQETAFPEEQGTTLIFSCEEPVSLTLQIRYPHWAQNGMEIRVNGRRTRVREQPGSFVAINRTWNDGDRVEVIFPFSLRLETMPDDENRIAVFYGPVVLAGDLGPEDDPGFFNDMLYVPVFIATDRNPENWMEPVEGEPNTFITKGLGYPREVTMKPFYQTHERRFSIFWDLFTQDTWQVRYAQLKKELEERNLLEQMTVDFFQPGDRQDESDHNVEDENSNPYRFRDRPSRVATGGWFSFDLQVDPVNQNILAVEYWRGGFRRPRIFEILVDGEKIADVDITPPIENRYFISQYEIPLNLTRGKDKVSVQFLSHERRMIGPVFGVRSVRRL